MKLIVVLIAVWLALFGLALIDDSLDSGPAVWASLAADSEDLESEAFHFLYGVMAHESEEPEAVGKALLQAYRELEERSNGIHDSPEFNGYPEHKRLVLPAGELYCALSDNSCFETLVSDTGKITAELEQHSVLLARYQTFLLFDDFKTLTKPTVHEKLPEYKYLQKGNRLNALLIVKKIADGEDQAAVDMLYSNISRLRRLLSKADSLFMKMVSVALLANDLDLLANLHAGGYIKDAAGLANLTVSERSMYLPMIREFGGSVNLSRSLDGNPEFFREGGAMPSWLIRAIFKPNMTINATFPMYEAVHQLSLKSASEFYKGMESVDALVEAGTSFNIRNAAGSVIVLVAMPDFTQFIIRMHDLDCKITLINIAITSERGDSLVSESTEESAPERGNPYDQNETPYINQETGKLCFSGPGKDEKARRCIRIKTS